MRRYSWLLALAAVIVMALPASAAPKNTDTETPGVTTGPSCDLAGYKNESQILTPPFAISDNGQVQVTVGFLPTPADGSVITDVILEAVMNHTWIGDLILQLDYMDCVTGVVAASTKVLCRPRGTGATTPAPCGAGTGVGCSGDLGTGGTTGTPVLYRWSDAAPAPMAEGVCPATIATGCYKPASGNAMAVFNGRLKGGCWRLSVSDWAGLDVGTIASWAVWELNQTPVSTRVASWGKLKTIYR